MFILAHLSDPHLAPLPHADWRELLGKRLTGYVNWHRRRKFIHDPATLAAIVADMKAQAPDHVAVTGDIANIALPEEFTRGRDWMESLGRASDVTFVPGNHDIYVREAGLFAARQWAAQMTDDDGSTAKFPFLRRRGPVAIIGLNTGVATAPLLATGWLGAKQLAEFAAILNTLRNENLFRVVLIHHPPVSPRPRRYRLLDAPILLRVLAAHGAELILHGHDHLPMTSWLNGPNGTRVPAVGVPCASAKPGTSKADAGYNLYRIEGSRGAWRCEMIARGVTPEGAVVERKRMMLSPAP